MVSRQEVEKWCSKMETKTAAAVRRQLDKSHVPAKAGIIRQSSRSMNKWEREAGAYLEYQRLAREIEDYGYQKYRLELANGCTYTPDFHVVAKGKVEFYEVKGFRRDDAIVKIKVAAREYPHHKFWLMYQANRVWITERVWP